MVKGVGQIVHLETDETRTKVTLVTKTYSEYKS